MSDDRELCECGEAVDTHPPYAAPRSRPWSCAFTSHAAIQASAVSGVTLSPMRRLRVAARRASSMRSGVDRRDTALGMASLDNSVRGNV